MVAISRWAALSHLSQVRGLKHQDAAGQASQVQSHLSQVRGLKRDYLLPRINQALSHLSQVRGLKHPGGD